VQFAFFQFFGPTSAFVFVNLDAFCLGCGMSERQVASRETPGTERAVPVIATVGRAIATVGPAIATAVVQLTSAAPSSAFGESRTKIAAPTIVGPTTSTTSGTCVAAIAAL
jgi:hypothetical protein